MLSYKQNSIFKRSRRIFMFFSNNFQPSAFGYRNWVTAPPIHRKSLPTTGSRFKALPRCSTRTITAANSTSSTVR